MMRMTKETKQMTYVPRRLRGYVLAVLTLVALTVAPSMSASARLAPSSPTSSERAAIYAAVRFLTPPLYKTAPYRACTRIRVVTPGRNWATYGLIYRSTCSQQENGLWVLRRSGSNWVFMTTVAGDQNDLCREYRRAGVPAGVWRALLGHPPPC